MAAAATAPSAGNNQFGLDAELFTRGATVDKDRGESMVQKHMEKMQQVSGQPLALALSAALRLSSTRAARAL